MRKSLGLLAATILSLMSLLVSADLVHVIEQTEVGGVTTVVSDETKITGMPWATATAPTVSGQIFTHWTISTKQEFVARDEWGRAYDAPSFKLYENTALTAHYLPATQDEDGDGIADGYEIYWYGNLGQGAASDTDGDGWTFAEELENGTNPLTPESEVDGPITYADTELHEANLQPFEQAQGALLDGEYQQLFYSPIAGNTNCLNFGAGAVPNVLDVNGDDLFDLVRA